jgi:hypothetical protein
MGKAYQKLSTVLQQHQQQHQQQPTHQHVKEELMKCYRTDGDREKEVAAFESIRLQVGREDTCFADFMRRFDQLHMKAERALDELSQGTYHTSKVNAYFVAALPLSIREDIEKHLDVKRSSIADLKVRAERLYNVYARRHPEGEMVQSSNPKRYAEGELDTPTRKRAAVARSTDELYDKISGILEQIPACVARSFDPLPTRIAETGSERLHTATRPGGAGRGEPPRCFAFQEGHCRYGATCRFSHGTRAEASRLQRPASIKCRMFEQKGACSFGSNCKYSHGSVTSSPCMTTAAWDGGCWVCGASDHEWYRCSRRCHACGKDDHSGFSCRVKKDGMLCNSCNVRGHLPVMCRDKILRERAREAAAKETTTMSAAASVRSPGSGIVHPDRQVPQAQNQVLSDLTNALKDVSKQLAAKNDA